MNRPVVTTLQVAREVARDLCNARHELWNSGSALEPGSELFTAHICKAAKRAIAARKGRKVGPREYNTQRSAVLRSVHG